MGNSVQCLPERILVHYQLGQLIITPGRVAKKIQAMKDNK